MTVRSSLRNKVVLHKLIDLGECSISIGKSGERFYHLTTKGNQMAKQMLEEMYEKNANDDLIERYEVSWPWPNGSKSLEVQHRKSGWYVDTHYLPVANFGENFFIHYYDGFPTLETAIEIIKHYLSVFRPKIDDIEVKKI